MLRFGISLCARKEGLMGGSGQLRMWGESVWIILTIVVLGVVLMVALILGWTFLRIWLRRGEIERAQTEKRAARLGPDGLPYPRQTRASSTDVTRRFRASTILIQGSVCANHATGR